MSDSIAGTIAMAVWLLPAILSGILGWSITQDYYRNQAIERGYAIYCPDNGRFAWKGECDE